MLTWPEEIMLKLLESIENSLTAENWYSALALSLVLPDICGKAEGKPQGRMRYIEWFDKYLATTYQGFLSGRDCYALRCSFLHEGSDAIETQQAREVVDRFFFIPKGPHCNSIGNSIVGDPLFDQKEILQLSVDQFCKDFVEAAKKWLTDNAGSSIVQDNLEHLIKIHEGKARIGGISFT